MPGRALTRCVNHGNWVEEKNRRLNPEKPFREADDFLVMRIQADDSPGNKRHGEEKDDPESHSDREHDAHDSMNRFRVANSPVLR